MRLDRVPEVMELISRGGWLLVVASANSSEVVILDAETLDEQRRVALSVDDSFWAMSFSPDGRLLAGGGESGKGAGDRHRHLAGNGDAVLLRDYAPTIQLDWLRDNRTVLSTSVTGQHPARRHAPGARPPPPPSPRTRRRAGGPRPRNPRARRRTSCSSTTSEWACATPFFHGVAPRGLLGRRPGPDPRRAVSVPARAGVRADLHLPRVRPNGCGPLGGGRPGAPTSPPPRGV